MTTGTGTLSLPRSGVVWATVTKMEGERDEETAERAGETATRADSSNTSSHNSSGSSSRSTAAVAGVVVGAERHSSRKLEVDAPAAGEAVKGVSMGVRQREGVGREVCHRIPSPRGGYN